ncbi:hypothetical protein CUR178_06444 [Leishmania enriettii]|uniref:Uncharacterized protein n=1 Tax=Leishmania enriettii TaxID=5663 RepID=A0A836GFU2_LEIEN|nr:hypothetical protein CUR178_06444 [Leishmania enriettii]
MELGQTQRPRAPVEPFQDYEPRRKCTVCCGLRYASFTGFATFCVSLVCNVFVLGGRVTDGRGWRGFLNRNTLLALPVAAITFTHQVLLSESLWSKNKKTVLQVNTQSTLSNMSLWMAGTALCTAVSRRYLPAHSRAYRLAMWEYQRTRRGCANPWMPTVLGRVTQDLDWYNVMWTLAMYHLLWGMVSALLEKELGAHYAMFYRNGQYSRWCSPRWREWRELEVIRHVNTEHVVSPNRWGTFITNDKWRTRNF